MVSEIKSETIDCTDGRTCLLESVAGLPDNAFDIPNVIGKWRVRDCLAHLVGWDAWALGVLGRAEAGTSNGPLPSEREINDGAAADWSQRPIADLLECLHDIRVQVVELISQMSDEERDAERLEFDGAMLSWNDLIDGMIEHEMEHAGQIRTWRKTQGV